MSETDNNQNTDFNTDYNPDSTSPVNTAGQSTDPGQGSEYPQQYDSSQQGYDQNNGYPYGQQQYNGQYQNYGQNGGYYNGQYQNYRQNGAYNNGQYQNYGQNGGYYNGQYQNYGQNGNYYNGQYQNYGQNGGYNNGQYNGPYSGYHNNQPYANPQAAYQQTGAVSQPVTNVFYYILMALTAISTVITIVFSIKLISTTFSAVNFDAAMSQDFNSLYSSMMGTFTAGTSVAYTLLTYLLSFAILALSIIDIVMVHKGGYPITGLILFTIFLKPGYFLWRAYVLKQKKTIPLLFTISYVIAYFVYFIWCFSFMAQLVSSMPAAF